MYRVTRYSVVVVAIAACWLCAGIGEPAMGQAMGQTLRGQAAFGSWKDDKPGLRRLLTPQDLPGISTATFGSAQVVPVPAGARPQVPSGFVVERVMPICPMRE